MKILITGADGFLGKVCVSRFISEGHTVITTDRKGSVNILGDLANPEFALKLPDVDVLIHCAAVQYVSEDLPVFNRKKYFYRNNILVTINLIKRYQGTNTHFINVATSMMYKQNGSEIYSIDSLMTGSGVYSESKLIAYRSLIRSSLKVSTVIPCIIGGVGREGLFVNFIRMIKKFGFVIYPGKGTKKIHMVHVTDVAELLFLIASNGYSGIYNAAGFGELSISEWVDEISIKVGKQNVIKVRIPLVIVKALSFISCYRLIAKEQLLMLEYPHVLSVEQSISIGWKPLHSNKKIISDICDHIK